MCYFLLFYVSFVIARRINTGAWALLWTVLSIIIFGCCYSFAETKAKLRKGALHDKFVLKHFDSTFSPKEEELDDLLDVSLPRDESVYCTKTKIASLIKSLLMGMIYSIYLLFGIILTMEAISSAIAAGKGTSAIYGQL